MNFLSSFSAIVYKEFTHISRDKVTLFITIIIPVFQLIIFGYAIDTDIKNIPTVVYDQDNRRESRGFVESLENTGYFEVKKHVFSDSELYAEVVAGRARVGIKLPPDFSAGLVKGGSQVLVAIDGSDSGVAMQALNVSNSVGLYESIKRIRGDAPVSMPVDVRPRMLFNPDLESANFFVPGLVGLIMQIVTVVLTSLAIVRERESGTLEQLLVTPVSKPGLMLGKLVPYAVLGFIEVCIVLTVMRYVFDVRINGSLLLLLVMSGLFLFTALGLGLLISTVAQNQSQAIQMAFLTMLPSVLLSGFMFPRESMPPVIYHITFLIPLTYFIEVLRGIIIRGADIQPLWDEGVILALYGCALLAISTKRFQKKIL